MADKREARALIKELGLPLTVINELMVIEALNRRVDIVASRSKPRIVFLHGGDAFRWSQGVTTLNSPLARRIGKFKNLQSGIFRNLGVNAPENGVFAASQAERAWRWAEPLGRLVVKPHNGMHGKNVHVGIDTWEDFVEAFDQVSGGGRGEVLVEEFRSGTEHRCLVVDQKLVAATRRRPSSVKGDGVSTIEGLVNWKNRDRGRIHKHLQMGDLERRYLAKQGLSFESVPADGDRVYLLGTSNIHTGGDAIDATDDITPAQRRFIERASRAIPGLRLAGFDVLLPQGTEDSEPTIIEVNHCPMTSMHHYPWEGRTRNVSAAIMDAMFPATKR